VAAFVPAVLGSLLKINHFVVLMLENRSFDHLLGALKSQNPVVDGALDGAFSNPTDPAVAASPVVITGPAVEWAMPFDPGHEFEDVQIQLYGRLSLADRKPAPPMQPAPMNGFAYCAEQTAKHPADAAMVALFNYWHASVPGPTWPNRFFAHAATSGGLSDSPTDPDILAGYTFPAGTIYRTLELAGKDWRIYHDGLPQAAGIDSLRAEYTDVFTTRFRDMKFFEEDMRRPALPEYIFIEPRYDTSHNFVKGNSMHPLNDVREGEKLVKRVYEALRASAFWVDSMLIVTFDEHGGFFDHVPPPPGVNPGGEQRYSDPANAFAFDRLGIRVPSIVASPYTQRNTVVGETPQDCYDHTAILATVQRRFDLAPLTLRDKAANTLESALNQSLPRLLPEDAPLTLPSPIADELLRKMLDVFAASPVDPAAPLTISQRVQLTLAHACDLQTLDPTLHAAARRRYLGVRAQQDAADYVQEVEDRIRDRREKKPV
jgi:phospholipase C